MKLKIYVFIKKSKNLETYKVKIYIFFKQRVLFDKIIMQYLYYTIINTNQHYYIFFIYKNSYILLYLLKK